MSKLNRRKKFRDRLFEAQKGLCFYCNRPMLIGEEHCKSPAYATYEHVIPRKLGGLDNKSNIVLACHRCNNIKDKVESLLGLNIPAHTWQRFRHEHSSRKMSLYKLAQLFRLSTVHNPIIRHEVNWNNDRELG